MKSLHQIAVAVLALVLTNCVQETHLKTINLKVNMKGVENISNLRVKGQFTSPPWQDIILLTDEDNDSIYEAKIEVQAAQFGIQFKFVNNEVYELEGQDNRFIKFEYEPETFVYETEFNNPESKLTKI